MKSDVQKVSYRDILKQKEYMKMIIAALINRFGDSIDAIAATWLVYEITGSAAWSAIIFGINRLPTIFVTPLAGAWVEGRNKKNIMIITDLLRAVCVFYVATSYLLGILQPWMLVITNFTISTVEAFRGPANTALTPKVLEKKYYSHGMSLLSTLSSIMELVGTAVAAGIIATIGISGAIYIDMITFILSAFVILFLKVKEINLQKQKFATKEYFETFTDGINYLKNERVISFFLLLTLFMNAVLVPCNSLQAPLVSEIFSGGAEVLSIMSISTTVSMLLGSIVYPKLDGKLSGKMLFFVCGLGIGIYYVGVIICQPLYTSKIFMYVMVAFFTAILGFCIAIACAFLNVEFVRRVDEKYMARVNAVSMSVSMASLPIVSFAIGGLVSYVSTALIFIFAGVLDIVICLFILRSKIMDSDTSVENEEEQESMAV